MTSTGQRDFVFAKIRRQIQHMLAAIARRDRNFDYNSCKNVIKTELSEAERITKELLSDQKESSELTENFMNLQDEVNDTFEKYKAMKRSSKCQWYVTFKNDIKKIRKAQLIVRILAILATLIMCSFVLFVQSWYFGNFYHSSSDYYYERFQPHQPLEFCPDYFSSPCYQQTLLCVLSMLLNLFCIVREKCSPRCSTANRYLLTAFELFSCGIFSFLWFYYLVYYIVGALEFDNNGAYFFVVGSANLACFVLWVLLTFLSVLRIKKWQRDSVVHRNELQVKEESPVAPPCYSAA